MPPGGPAKSTRSHSRGAGGTNLSDAPVPFKASLSSARAPKQKPFIYSEAATERTRFSSDACIIPSITGVPNVPPLLGA